MRARENGRHDAPWRRMFEKLKKNRGGVYRSRGWKNFSDGGFWMVVDRSPNIPPRYPVLRRADLPYFFARK